MEYSGSMVIKEAIINMKKSGILFLAAGLALATATPVQETSQTAAGVTIVKQDATYYATSDVNLRTDCSTDAQIIQGVAPGTALTSTGVSQDGQWIEVNFNGQTCYISAQFASTTAPAAATDATAAQ